MALGWQGRQRRSKPHQSQPVRNKPPTVRRTEACSTVSKAQLTAFFARVEADPALKLQVEAAADASAVVAIAQTAGFHFSPASLSRHLRG